KGANIWDTLVHEHPEYITDRSNGDIAANSYFKYKEDIQLMKQLGVTMFHWDLPQRIQDIGGFANKFVTDIFVDYARVLFTQFGNRVKCWITVNEPAIFSLGYTRKGFAPGVDSKGIGDYLSVHNLILSHAKTYHMSSWYYFELCMLGLHAHAIYSKEGDYPKVVKERILNRSLELGFLKSRLPKFSKEEMDYVRGSFDFFGLNHYTTYLVTPGLEEGLIPPSLEDDIHVLRTMDPSWPSTGGPDRKHYLYEVLNAIVEDGCNVFAYSPWSFIDNFEWTSGYTQMFGLYQVDFNNPDRPRIPKESSLFYADILKTRQIPAKYLEDI
ncbi:Myrosinase 1, partial [Blattella germanica]